MAATFDTTSTTQRMFAIYRTTGGDLARSYAATSDRGCRAILDRFARNRTTGERTGCTRWGITRKGARFVALDGTKADRDLAVVNAWGGILDPAEVRS